jgi:hypothetical protein
MPERGWPDLGALWEMLRQDLDNRGFLVFPAALLPLGPTDARPEALWPDEDIASFLDFASSLGAQVVYAGALQLEDVDLDNARARLGHDETSMPREEITSFIADWEVRLGQIHTVAVTFPYGNVLHFWIAQSDWWIELQDRFQEERQASALVRAAENTARVEELARQLSSESSFQRAPNKQTRIRVAWQLLPDLRREFEDGDRPLGLLVARAAVRAWEVYQEEVLPEKERKIARDAHGLLATGLKKYEVAARLRVSEDKLNRLLSQWPVEAE